MLKNTKIWKFGEIRIDSVWIFTDADDLRSLYIAYGSVCELETQVLLSGDLNYVNKENLKALKDDTEEVERMLKALIKSLEKKRLDPWPLESSNPLLQLNWRRTNIKNYMG